VRSTIVNWTATPRFAVDLFAFWNPVAWGLESLDDLLALGGSRPRELWDRLLGMLVESGVAEFEVTFAPFDGATAVAAYGGPREVRAALDAHGLAICGAYLPAIEDPDRLMPERRDDLLRETAEIAGLLAGLGARALVGSAPPRATRSGRPAHVVGLDTVQRLADLYNELGVVCRAEGLDFGLHVESHSALWLERDIDLFMLLTDPFYVGLCPDAGHIVLGGGDPVAVATRHRRRLVAAHWKDAIGPISWDLPIDAGIHDAHRELTRIPGDGIVDWAGWAAALAPARLTDPVLLEADASPTPVADIRAAIAYLSPLL
jgi:inosose dehydratase